MTGLHTPDEMIYDSAYTTGAGEFAFAVCCTRQSTYSNQASAKAAYSVWNIWKERNRRVFDQQIRIVVIHTRDQAGNQ